MMYGFYIFYAMINLFQCPSVDDEIERELLTVNDSPVLWQRESKVAKHLQIAIPNCIFADIDDNFF